jgi:hypothetical protein
MRASTSSFSYGTADSLDSHSEASASPAPSLSRSKRWASGSELGEHTDNDNDEEVKPRSKRTKAGSSGSAAAVGAKSSAAVPANEKEQRKVARMIRNRSGCFYQVWAAERLVALTSLHPFSSPDAAQASRDRKKVSRLLRCPVNSNY